MWINIRAITNNECQTTTNECGSIFTSNYYARIRAIIVNERQYSFELKVSPDSTKEEAEERKQRLVTVRP